MNSIVIKNEAMSNKISWITSIIFNIELTTVSFILNN